MEWSGITFTDNKASDTTVGGSSFSAVGSEESGIYEESTWSGLLTSDTSSGEFVLAKATINPETGTFTTVEETK